MAQDPKVFDPIRDLNILEMNKYVGTWEWKSNNTSFILVLKKWKAGENLYLINGWYRFTKNGKTVINQLDSVDKVKYSGLTGSIIKGNDSLKFSFSDPTREELRHGSLSFIGGNLNRLIFKLQMEKRPQRTNQFAPKRGKIFTEKIPSDLNLTMNRVE